ncbi:MAG: signal peptidase I [Oscillospiraceae bacterium]|nr:signal peptidase I [Oscillospiraceae bacterium]
MDKDNGIPENGGSRETAEDSGIDIGSEIYDWAQALTFSIVIVVLLFTFFARIIGVEGPSMTPTLMEADRIIISDLFYTPKNGDVVVFRKESFMTEPLVKRIIATEGQTVDINFDTNEVFVDGALLDEEYINEPTRRKEDVVFPVKVPQGHVFVMGDNRNHSTDSRRQSVGMVDERLIIGRVIFRIYPFNKLGTVKG